MTETKLDLVKAAETVLADAEAYPWTGPADRDQENKLYTRLREAILAERERRETGKDELKLMYILLLEADTALTDELDQVTGSKGLLRPGTCEGRCKVRGAIAALARYREAGR